MLVKDHPGAGGPDTVRVRIPKIILGGMGAKPGRKTFNRNVSASEEETGCFKRMIEGGTEICYQLVPSEKEVNIRKLL